MRQQGEATKYPGVYRVGDRSYRVRAKLKDPRTGLSKEVDRLIEGVSALEAARRRAELVSEAKAERALDARIRVGDFARSWLKSKALKLDRITAERYAVALDNHVLPVLGALYYDALSTADVQAWVDGKLASGRFSVPTVAFTGLRFCHASALHWQDLDETRGLLRVVRKQVRGQVGPVSRKKRAPREVPVEAAVVQALTEHRACLVAEQAPGLEHGWMFPSETGTLRQTSSLAKAWRACCRSAGITRRFTVHGLRYTFNDLTRRAGINGVVTRALTGHVTESMTRHYSTIGLDEKREAVARVLGLVGTRRG